MYVHLQAASWSALPGWVADGLPNVELDFVIDCVESVDGDDLVEGVFSPILSGRALSI